VFDYLVCTNLYIYTRK